MIALPTIEVDVDRSHTWLNYPVDKVGPYNNFDCIAAAIARRELPVILAQSRNADYFAWWNAHVVPAAMNVQRRGFGHLDKGRQALYKRKVNTELFELEKKLLGETKRFDRMRDEAEAWRQEHERKDLAAATAKNTTKKKPLPEHLVPVTKGRQRQIGYESRLRKIEEARERFLNSNDMKAEFIFDELGLKPAPRTHKRPARSIGQHALLHIYRHLRQKDEPHKWVVEDLFHRSRLNTIRTRYLDPPVGPENRIYPHLRVYGSETLRWAYSDPALHQWVPEIRHLVVARRGHCFVACDWAQLEARIMAYLAGDQQDIEAFEDRSRDVHAETAQDLFRLTPEEWGGVEAGLRKKMRDFAKTKRYEIGYGGSGLGNQAKAYCPCPRCADKVPQMLALSPQEQRTIMKRWEAKRPTTLRWREDTYQQCLRNNKRWTSDVSGYSRQFFRPASEIRTELANYPCQHTAAELMNRAVVKLDQLGAPLVFTHHDALVLEVPLADRDHWASVLKEVMEEPVPELNNARFPTDPKQGEDWGQL